MRPALRFCITLIATLFYAFLLQTEYLQELDRLGAYQAEVAAGAPDTGLPPNNEILLYAIYSLCGPIEYLLLYLHCRKHHISFPYFNPQLWSTVISSLGAIMCELKMHSDIHWATSNTLSEIGDWTTLWMVGLWLTVIFQLEQTEYFGVIVKTFKSMVVKLAAFSILLWIIIYCYASVYLMRNYHSRIQSMSLLNAMFYFTSAMLGNYDPSELYTSDTWDQIIIVSFLLITAIVMLSLLVAILTHTYESNQSNLLLALRRIRLETVSMSIIEADTRLLNCSGPPFSMLSILFSPLVYTSGGKFYSTLVLKGIYVVFILGILMVGYVIVSLIMVVPVFVLKTYRIIQGDHVGNGERKVGKWLVTGIPVLLGLVIYDSIDTVKTLLADVEPDLLSKRRITPRSSTLEADNSSLLSTSQDSLSSPSYQRLSQTTGADSTLCLKICTYNSHYATRWVLPEAMERRFYMALEFVDIELITSAIDKTENTDKRTDRDIRTAVNLLQSIVKPRLTSPQSEDIV